MSFERLSIKLHLTESLFGSQRSPNWSESFLTFVGPEKLSAAHFRPNPKLRNHTVVQRV